MKIQLIKELKIKNSNVQFVIKKLGSVEFLQDAYPDFLREGWIFTRLKF